MRQPADRAFGATRNRLTAGIYVSANPTDATGRIEAAFAAAVERDAMDEKLRAALGKGARAALANPDLGVKANMLTRAEQAESSISAPMPSSATPSMSTISRPKN